MESGSVGNIAGKNIMIAIPKSQFEEGELLPLRDALKNAGAHVVVLSKSGQKARGMEKTMFEPDGMIVDWNKQKDIVEKYHAVVVLGGRGAPKSLWDDPILPQILTDHYRAGRITAAMGQGIPVLVRAGLLAENEIPKADEEDEAAVVLSQTVVIASGKGAAKALAATLIELLQNGDRQ